MAKTNNIDICGSVYKTPKISENKDRASFILITTRGNRDAGTNERKIHWDSIVVLSKDPEVIQAISQIEDKDIVRIKGVIVTKNVPKKTYCPQCGTENIVDGVLVYVEPIYVEKITAADDGDVARQMVYDRREVSNQVRIIGDLCCDPSFIKGFSPKVCQYQIAIPRTYRLKGSSDDDKTDFPWVKSYGKNAVEDMKRLRTGSLVLIDGCLQARKQIKTQKCENCQKEYQYNDSTLEVVPYETEYLKNYKTDEEK